MPIIDLQRRHAELGRIRLGHKAPTQRGGTRPAKLDTFRLTSPSERFITRLAELYGGEARPWDNSGKKEWEVFTEARSMPVVVVQGGLTQWMETWSGGGCIHRCDGRHNVLTDTPCDPQDPNHVNAKPTTRLSVMLRELDAIGVWRLETHGWNAAVELPTNVDLAAMVGSMVKANLTLQERTAIRDGKTSRFVVPGLDLEVAPAQLVALAQGGRPGAIAGASSGAAAIEAPRPDYAAVADTLLDVESVRDLWKQAAEAGHLDDDLKAVLTARVEAIKAGEVSDDPTDYDEDVEPEKARLAAAKREAQRAVDEPVDAEVVDDEPADPRKAAWQELMAAGGTKGLGFDELRGLVEQHAALPLADVTVEHLREVLHLVTTGELPEAVPA